MKKLLLPRPTPAKRKRGGQPGNRNALKHGKFTREIYALRRDVRAHILRGRALIAQLEPRSVCCDGKAFGRDGEAIAAAIKARQRLLERPALPIAHGVGVEHPMRNRQRRLGRAGGGLAIFHMDDRPPFLVMGQAVDLHGVERIDLGKHV